jgi:hypothetical protein
MISTEKGCKKQKLYGKCEPFRVNVLYVMSFLGSVIKRPQDRERRVDGARGRGFIRIGQGRSKIMENEGEKILDKRHL